MDILPTRPYWATIAMVTATSSLYLAPTDLDSAPVRNTIENLLSELGVTGAHLGPVSYLAGAGFARHVVFAGCSPHLVMEPPPEGGNGFCHVALHGPFDRPRLVTGPNTRAPRCPACRTPVDNWYETLFGWRTLAEPAVCDRCGLRASPLRLDWRRQAVVGRVLIEFRNVFPGEATPSDRLMESLHELSGTGWRYAWAASLSD